MNQVISFFKQTTKAHIYRLYSVSQQPLSLAHFNSRPRAAPWLFRSLGAWQPRWSSRNWAMHRLSGGVFEIRKYPSFPVRWRLKHRLPLRPAPLLALPELPSKQPFVPVLLTCAAHRTCCLPRSLHSLPSLLSVIAQKQCVWLMLLFFVGIWRCADNWFLNQIKFCLHFPVTI